jgi:hypothetical protein
MRKLFLISVLIFYSFFTANSQVEINIDCQDSWGPGRYNKVTVRIDFGKADGFARFTQDFPVGFDIIPDNIPAGDFTWADKQLNMVWIKLPGEKIVTFSYQIRPDRTMNGSFEMSGKVVLISEDDTKQSFLIKGKPITISGTNGLLPEEITSRHTTGKSTNVTRLPIITDSIRTGSIDYRIQISLSSSEISADEIRRRFGIDRGEKVKIVKAGKMFKYQVGSFSDYVSANSLLTRLIAKGIKDAFIVAYQGENQIRIEKSGEPVR